MGQLLLRGARRWPDKEAVVFPDRRITYRELADRAWSIARSLRGLGIRPRQHVGILMTNHPDLVSSLFGIAMMGGVVVPINARYRTSELKFLVKDADLSAVITTDCGPRTDFAQLLRDGLPGLGEASDPARLDLPDFPELRAVVTLADGPQPGLVTGAEFRAMAERADADELARSCSGVALRDLMMILYTSGTTSEPWGAMLTHEAFIRIWMSTGRCFGMTEEDRFWDPLPLFHVAALGPLTFTLGHGGTFITDAWFDAERSLKQIEEERATLLYPTYPPIMQAMLTHPRFPETDLSSVKAYLNVAPPETLKQFQKFAPHAVQLTTYGATECGPASFNRVTDSEEQRLYGCGTVQPGVEIRVVGPDGTVLGPNEPGELHIRGYNTFSGYYGDPEKTAEAVLEDGWIRIGDYGTVDEHGQVMFLGRIKEMMKVGGENVAPAEIEAHIGTHPAVKLAQAIGVPDPRLVEVPVVYAELHDGREATEEELIEHCRGRIASFKVPRAVRFVKGDEWPMSTTKIQKFKLRERFLAEQAEQSASVGRTR